MVKKRELLSRLLLLCAASIAMAAIAEAALRIRTPADIQSLRRSQRPATGERCDPLYVRDPTRGWRLVPNCTTTATAIKDPEYAITIHTNNRGFRDYQDYQFGRNEAALRILVLGDSFSYGNGVEELARYSNLLDDLLGENVEVYNLALSNYGLDQALLTFEAAGLRYDPDVVILGFSDPMLERLSRPATDSLWSKPFFELDQEALAVSSQPSARLLALGSLLDRSQLWLFVSRRASARLGMTRSKTVIARNTVLAEKLIERLAATASRKSFSLVVFTINPVYSLKRELATIPLNRSLERASAGGGFHFLDLYPVFKSSNYASLFYPIDGHYNGDGHVLVAEQLCQFIRSRGILHDDGFAPSCEVDQEAVRRSIEELESCTMGNANKALFPRGECIPRR